MSPISGSISIENFWNEDLRKVEIHYHRGSTTIDTVFILYNVADKKTIKDAHSFTFNSTDKSDWKAKITTKQGQTWSSGEFFPCQLTDNDNGKVTIRFNGDARTMHVIYPTSLSCTKKMVLI
ncbi:MULTISPECIES: hypothetical protein [Providencia]|uniref:hypothetical protein n=1 Tax=Providencia TaxID=586 RepID=UPI0008394814|nr:MULTISPECIES: hypothetical protein [Providencia]MBP6121929.1 hypothetical protein [Providencia sp.]NIH21581.1 hypothetical protein [Providencia heimbachae]QCJ69157.1 hypothetical protein C9446_04275 [Providencia heimbachae]